MQLESYFSFIFDPFQSSVAVHLETSHFIYSANQMNGFYMKSNNWVKWVKVQIVIHHVTFGWERINFRDMKHFI